ncbi:MAG: sugar ABC transporter permease [Spirochaetales bacterium]|nr:sugar ABC transporter permease [Spirochaetales bacterium]
MREYRLYVPYSKMPWIGLEKFRDLVAAADFWRAFKNTVIISGMQIIFGFPIPVILAILFSELRFPKFKRFTQTVLTLPHFLSWVILSGIFFNLLGNTGIVNGFLAGFGLPKQNFLMNPGNFRGLLVVTNIWKEAGWSSIIYLAAIMSIETSQYEAAEIDGANRWQQVIHVTLPAIMSIVIVMLILRIGNIVNYSFLQVFLMYSQPVYNVGDVIETYIYRITFERPPDFSFSTAVGVFKGLINLFMLVTANTLAKRLGYRGIY